MFIQSIVYVVLAVLSATAAYAASMPIKKAPREEHASEPTRETSDSLES